MLSSFAFSKHEVIPTTSNQGECDSMDKLCIMKFYVAEASVSSGTIQDQDSFAVKPFDFWIKEQALLDSSIIGQKHHTNIKCLWYLLYYRTNLYFSQVT